MTRIERDGETFVVPALLLAEAFGLSEAEVKAALRSGMMTTRSEAGLDEDAGRWRLSFYYRDRALRLIVDAEGRILKRARFPIRTAAGGTGTDGQRSR